MLNWRKLAYELGQAEGLEAKKLQAGDRFVIYSPKWEGKTVGCTVLQGTKYTNHLPAFPEMERDVIIRTDDGEIIKYYAGEIISNATIEYIA